MRLFGTPRIVTARRLTCNFQNWRPGRLAKSELGFCDSVTRRKLITRPGKPDAEFALPESDKSLHCREMLLRADSVEKVASLKWLQICQNTNDIFD